MQDILNDPIQIDNPTTQMEDEHACKTNTDAECCGQNCQTHSEPDVVKIAVLIDESGSMLGAANDTINNLNGYIDEQATSEKEILISVYTFNGDRGVRERFVGVNAKRAPHMGLVTTGLNDDLIYVPRGGTPLWDAIATMIIRETSTVPTLVVILTDGQENASREYKTLTSIQALIKQQEEMGWSFVFLMAGLSRQVSEIYTCNLMGRSYGGSTMTYAKGTETVAFHNLRASTADWDAQARVANAAGAIMDSITVSQNFFDPTIREIKTDQETTVTIPKTKK